MPSIFPQNAQYHQKITLLTSDYLMSSMAMFIFSATLAVHISCAYRSIRLLLKKPANTTFMLNTCQSFLAVICHLSAVSGYYFITHCHFKGFFNWAFYYGSNTIMELLIFVRLHNDMNIFRGYLLLGGLLEIAKLGMIILVEIGINAYNGELQQCVISVHMTAFLAYMSTEVLIYVVQLCGAAYTAYKRYSRSSAKSIKSVLATNAAGLTMMSCCSSIFWFSLLLGGVTFNLNPDVLFQTKWAISSKLFSLQVERIEKLRQKALLPHPKNTDFESSNFADAYHMNIVSSSKLTEEDPF
ncbi:hypothetical protein K493DRAFT_298039 [Basidiobolus meristosporus CBS 931.73]|uniref:Uncharacterized protein n=1 Tax=Basidiobolus meristosporus CBS 931.73 TaxID=1314790 RepID=A0A1Y1YVS6_9FUNG|nr:hypothetical protein K493DRAFT_298039 [Basidiobolus meristosporus CBS 931.73]|eukprot:ORY02152.1 hypothetical protein K493DRAFT_298039 [Basidiobolus meristosporus CBS 931.73]